MTTFSGIVRQSVTDMLAAERLSADELATRVAARHVAEFAAQAEQLAMASVRRMVKDVLRGFEAEDEGQSPLPLAGLQMPSAIAVRDDDRVYYVLTEHATWAEVQAGAVERASNVDHALARQLSYQLGMDRLRPYMQDDPDRTVAEALEAEAAAAQKAAS